MRKSSRYTDSEMTLHNVQMVEATLVTGGENATTSLYAKNSPLSPNNQVAGFFFIATWCINVASLNTVIVTMHLRHVVSDVVSSATNHNQHLTIIVATKSTMPHRAAESAGR